MVVLSNNDGCVIALSSEARALGITMGQPWFEVRQRFAKALPVAFSSNYTLYEAVSERVMASLRSFGHPTEVYSIDEAFLQLPRDFPPELQAEQLELRGIACFEFQSQGRRQRQIRHARSLAYDKSNLNTLSTWLAGFVVQAALKLRRQDLLAGRLGVYLQTNRFRSLAETERDPAFVSRRLEAACKRPP